MFPIIFKDQKEKKGEIWLNFFKKKKNLPKNEKIGKETNYNNKYTNYSFISWLSFLHLIYLRNYKKKNH